MALLLPNPPIPAGADAYRVNQLVNGVEYMGYVNSVYIPNVGERGVAQHILGAPNVVNLVEPGRVHPFVNNAFSNATFYNIVHFIPYEEIAEYFENPANQATINALTAAERHIIAQRTMQRLASNAEARRVLPITALMRNRGWLGGTRSIKRTNRKVVRKNNKRQSRKYN
jgi:hypothetical protein